MNKSVYHPLSIGQVRRVRRASRIMHPIAVFSQGKFSVKHPWTGPSGGVGNEIFTLDHDDVFVVIDFNEQNHKHDLDYCCIMADDGQVGEIRHWVAREQSVPEV